MLGVDAVAHPTGVVQMNTRCKVNAVGHLVRKPVSAFQTPFRTVAHPELPVAFAIYGPRPQPTRVRLIHEAPEASFGRCVRSHALV